MASSNFPRRRFQAFDLAAFDDPALNSASEIMQMFSRQTNRVLKIFDTAENSKSETINEDQSYGVRLVSQNHIENAEEPAGTSSKRSNKENKEEPEIPSKSAEAQHREKRKTSLHIRNLSPVDIITLSPTEISEQLPNPSSQSLFKPPHDMPSKSLRRSLFKLPQDNSEHMIPISSTPLSHHRQAARGTLMGMEMLSPIQQSEITPEKNKNDDIRGIEKLGEDIATSSKVQTPMKVTKVLSLAELENDLRSQYEIESTPTRRSRATRRSKTPGKMEIPARQETPEIQRTNVSHKSLVGPLSPVRSRASESRSVHKCSVILEPMSIESAISNYRQGQIRRLSVSNKTNFNSILMVETPVSTPKSKDLTRIDPVLAEKLQKCEESDDGSYLTDDEEVLSQPMSIVQGRNSYKQKLNSSNKSVQKSFTIRNSDDQQLEVEVARNNKSNSKKFEPSDKNDPISSTDSSAEKPRPVHSKALQIQQKSIAQRDSDRESSPSPVRETRSKQNKRNGKNSKQQGDGESEKKISDESNKNPEEIVFRRPLSVSAYSENPESDNSIDRTVGSDFIRSIRSIVQRTIPSDSPEATSTEQEKTQLTKLKKKRKIIVKSSVKESYMDIVQKNADKRKTVNESTMSRKRMALLTLLSDSNDELERPLKKSGPSQKSVVASQESVVASQEFIAATQKSVGTPQKVAETSQKSVVPSQESARISLKPKSVQKQAVSVDAVRDKTPEKEKVRQTRSKRAAEPSNEVPKKKLKKIVEEKQPAVVEKEQKKEKRSKKQPELIKSLRAPNSDSTQEPDSALQKETTSKQSTVEYSQQIPEEPMLQEKENEPSPVKTQKRKHQKKQVRVQSPHRESSPDSDNSPPPDSGHDSLPQSEGDDEGFVSDNRCEYNDVRYDPYERGCKRPGLRIRRYGKPWWIPSIAASLKSADNIGFVFDQRTTFKQLSAEVELKKKLAESGIQERELLRSSLESYMKPSEKLRFFNEREKELQKAKKDRDLQRQVFLKPKPVKASKKKNVEADGEGSDTISTTSMHTCVSTNTDSSSIMSILESISTVNLSKTSQGSSIQCNEFDMAQISNIKFTNCGMGCFFGSFVENSRDGLIKLVPGGVKPQARSKNSCLKFFVVHGNLEVNFPGKESVAVNTFGFLNVKPNHYYELRNRTEQDVIVSFMRFDINEKSNANK